MILHKASMLSRYKQCAGHLARTSTRVCLARPVVLYTSQDRARSLSARARKDEDRSWGELLSDAASLAKTALVKIKDAATSAFSPAPVAKQKQESRIPQQRAENLLTPSTGLFGKVFGGILSNMVNMMGQEIAKSAADRDAVYNEAAARIYASQCLRDRLGTVQVGPTISQSVSSMNVNGQVTKNITLIIPLTTASRLTAQAQVQYQESSRSKDYNIMVRLPDGSVMSLEDGPSGKLGSSRSGQIGQTIDVEFREVDRR